MSVPKQKSKMSVNKPCTLAVCHKCGGNCTLKDTVLCNKCKNRYDFDCIGLSEKLYRLMSNDKKLNWKCPTCTCKNNKSKTATNEENNNITHRRKKNEIPQNVSKSSNKPETPKSSLCLSVNDSEVDYDSHILTQEEISDESYSVTDRLSRSAEHIQLNDTITEFELREENKRLKINLISTETELEHQILENNDLNKCITRLNKELNLLKNLCKVPYMTCQESNKRNSLQPSLFFTPPKAPSSEKKTKHLGDFTYLQTKISNLKQELLNAQLEIHDLNKQIDILNKKIGSEKNCTKLDHTEELQIENPEESVCSPNKQQNARTIYIIGDEQLKGLSTAMLRSRRGKWNDNYMTSATIFSGAPSSEMLKSCKNISSNLSKDDIVILGFGSHDSDLNLFHSNLCIAINMLAKSTVYIIPVYHSPYFNENKLYKAMKLWIKHFENCSVIDYSDSVFSNDSSLTNIICSKINLHIDYYEYKKQFLTFQNMRKLIKNNVKKGNDMNTIINRSKKFFNNKNNQTPKKGTIPYYFKIINRSDNNDVIPVSPQVTQTHKKGSNNFFRIQRS